MDRMDESLAACIRDMDVGPSDEEMERILKSPGFDWFALDMQSRDVNYWMNYYREKWSKEKKAVDAYNENNWESFNKFTANILKRVEAAEKEVRLLMEEVEKYKGEVAYLRNKQFEKKGDYL